MLRLAFRSMQDASQLSDSHYDRVERVLLHVADARERAHRTADELQAQGAELHLIAAVRQAEAELERVHRELLQATYFAVADRQLAL